MTDHSCTKKRTYPMLIVLPIICILIGAACMYAAVFVFRHDPAIVRWMYYVAGLVGVSFAALMIHTNISRGWGWHGQRWPR